MEAFFGNDVWHFQCVFFSFVLNPSSGRQAEDEIKDLNTFFYFFLDRFRVHLPIFCFPVTDGRSNG